MPWQFAASQLGTAPTCFSLQLHRHQALEGGQAAAARSQQADQLAVQRGAALLSVPSCLATLAGLACSRKKRQQFAGKHAVDAALE